MGSSKLRRLIGIGVILALPVTGHAQEATLSGTVTDSTGGVLPGVMLRAVHEASGNTFEVVTDERGAYRLPVRTGVHRITAELSGFSTVTRSVELLVGQQAVANLQMAPATVQESVTVTGEAPLLETTQSSLGGNIDPRQMQELPVNGRNWMDLTMLAPGSRANAISTGNAPAPGGVTGTFRINIDGQDVTGNCCGTRGQASFSREAIGEFEFVSNRFDATQGRSAGLQVNVITKSGTNTPSGSLAGYFRDDRLNAADFIQQRVLPYSNQQLSGTFGGPIRRDRIHLFSNYEFEREPHTATYSSPFPSFNIDYAAVRNEHKAGTRLDAQFSPQTRLSARGSIWSSRTPVEPTLVSAASEHPSAIISSKLQSQQAFATLTQVLSNRAVNEVKAGWAATNWRQWPPIRGWAGARTPDGSGAPRIQLRGYSIGPQTRFPQHIGQDVYSVRDDLTYSFNKGGRHDLKTGAEYLKYLAWLHWCSYLNPQLFADNAPIPANIEQLFPVWDDPSTWNIAALSPITRQYRFHVGTCTIHNPRNIFAGWVQDDWAITPRLTLNLGVRYDMETEIFANSVAVPPFLEANRPNDTNNISPRLGFAYSLTDRTVIRGGSGTYFSQVINQAAHPVFVAAFARVVDKFNDGRADFAANPYNGPLPTFEELEQQYCNVNFVPGCVPRTIAQSIAPPNAKTPFSYQTSIGVQRQLGDAMAVETNYVFTGLRRDRSLNYNINLSYNPATGTNYPYTDVSRLPYPDWGSVLMSQHEGWSNYHGLETAFTKRFRNGWQAQGTYTLSAFWDGTPPPLSGLSQVTFPLAADLGEQYGLATTDQRHRAVFNGIWEVGYGFQLSGLYFFGSGERFSTSYGGDLRLTGGALSAGRLRPNGTIVPRNNFVGKPIHRVDLRVQRRFPIAGRAAVDGILEVFNLFNHENYGSYVTQESNRRYGNPTQNLNVAYQPRMLQVGFRVAF